MSGPGIEPLGEEALLLRLGDGIDPETNRRVHALAVFVAGGSGERNPLAEAEAWLRAFVGSSDEAYPEPEIAAPVEIPVCYASEYAPDLGALAAHAGLPREEVVARHCAGDYRVAMIGFAPGFPYLLGLDPALAMPRLSTPRTRVPAGSVAIGGAQTGIYPRDSPGGWHVIGRTPLPLFDAGRMPPALLAPGQRVRFRAIDADAFRQWPQAQA